MNFKPLALLGALLLAGCNDELMTLRFQDAAGSPGTGLLLLKQEQLDALLTAHQIDQQSLRWRVDLEDNHLVHVSVLKPLDDAQRSAVRALFDPLMKARAASTLDIEVTLDIPAQQREELSAVQREQIASLPQPLIVKLALEPEILTMALMPRGDDDVMGDVMEQVSSRVSCQLQARPVEPLPAGVTALWTLALDGADQVSVEMGEWSYPARYRFRDPDLQRQVQSGALQLLPATRQSVNSLIVEVGFADLGQHRLYSHFPLQQHAPALIRECEYAANALPRPLSFHVGEGLDRLETITYKDVPQ